MKVIGWVLQPANSYCAFTSWVLVFQNWIGSDFVLRNSKLWSSLRPSQVLGEKRENGISEADSSHVQRGLEVTAANMTSLSSASQQQKLAATRWFVSQFHWVWGLFGQVVIWGPGVPESQPRLGLCVAGALCMAWRLCSQWWGIFLWHSNSWFEVFYFKWMDQFAWIPS